MSNLKSKLFNFIGEKHYTALRSIFNAGVYMATSFFLTESIIYLKNLQLDDTQATTTMLFVNLALVILRKLQVLYLPANKIEDDNE